MYHQSKVIGIIEDDEELRETLGELLSSYGYATELYASADEFVGAAKTSRSACLLVNFDLQGMSGAEMGRRLVEDGHSYPIIFLAEVGQTTLPKEAWQGGGIALLQKPFFPNELLDAVAYATRLPC
jgi:FixJ family two-component response regulator